MTIDRSDKGLAQNAAFVLAAELAVQVVRAATIFILARLFPNEEIFGTYVSLLALTTLLAPVSQWGMNHVGVRAVAHNIPFAETWAKVISTISAGGFLGSSVATLVATLVLDVRPSIALAFGIAQLVGFNAAQAATMMTEAHHRSDIGLRINITGGVVRLSLLAAFWLVGDYSLGVWAMFLVVGMVAWGALSSIQVARAFGGAHYLERPSAEDLRHGFGFVFVQTSSSGQTDVDKLLLRRHLFARLSDRRDANDSPDRCGAGHIRRVLSEGREQRDGRDGLRQAPHDNCGRLRHGCRNRPLSLRATRSVDSR